MRALNSHKSPATFVAESIVYLSSFRGAGRVAIAGEVADKLNVIQRFGEFLLELFFRERCGRLGFRWSGLSGWRRNDFRCRIVGSKGAGSDNGGDGEEFDAMFHTVKITV